MGHSYYRGWDTKPKLDEARVVAPEVPTHRSRKNTRKWCRGKVGVEHRLNIRLSKWGVSILQRMPQSDYAGCGWKLRRRWVVTADSREWLPVPGNWRWNCNHEEYCTECGKITKTSLLEPTRCPSWSPRPE